jgi:hypothetical protein
MNLRHVATAGIVMTLCALGLMSSPQKDISVDGDGQTTTIDCKGGAVNVGGDDNTVTLMNECSRLTVSGDDNTIRAEIVTQVLVSGDDNTIAVHIVGKINTSGDDNTISWAKGAGGKAPEISNTGDDNKTAQSK